MTERTCGGCTACCRVLPVVEVGTKGYQPCPHLRGVLERAGPGCGIYENRPPSCRVWRCGWLENADWEDELRPDRCGFIVDEVLDMIRLDGVELPAAQIWALPGHEEAYREQPALAVIAAILHTQGLAVLWRVQGHLARGFALGPDGKIGISDPTPDDGPDLLGGAIERHRAASRLTRVVS